MKVDYMKKTPQWKRIVIKDRTKYTLKNGRVVLSPSNMERRLAKMIDSVYDQSTVS